MKKFISGFIVGALLFCFIPIQAAIEEYICYKADYKVVINSKQYVDADHPILNYKGSTYAPLRPMLEFAGLDVNWNAELGQAEVTAGKITPTPAPTPEPSPTSIPSPTPASSGLHTLSELQKFLDNNYSSLNTELGTTKFTFVIYENTSNITPYDYWIMVEYDSQFFYDLSYSINISNETREKIKLQLKDHQEKLAKEVISAMPNKKFYGGYHDSWYRYPALQVDLITRHYYSWTNYVGQLFTSYQDTTPSAFRWYPDIDDIL
jgi:hypothetical protein